MLQNLSSKGYRKTKRVIEKVAQEWNVTASKEPTKIILLCNAGLMTGASYEEIFAIFSPFGDVEDVQLLPNRSYSFIHFCENESAVKAYDSIHGQLILPQQNNQPDQVLYLSYVDRSPPSTCKLIQHWKNPWPEGLRLVENFITEEEEKSLLAGLHWKEGDSQLKHRQVLHFGHKFVYGSNSIDTASSETPFPPEWNPILQRAVEAKLLPYIPDQCTVNRYEVGHGIPAHVDSHECCDQTLASLSLVSDVVMNFCPLEEEEANEDSAKSSILLKAQSLLVLSGKARYAYSHGIPPKHSDIVPLTPEDDKFSSKCRDETFRSKERLTLKPRGLRISLTFRKTIQGPCRCSFPSFCASQKDARMTLDETLASALEKTHVHSVYENIAGHFSETRHRKWPRVEEFVTSLSLGSVLVDVGCGNGKYLGNENLAEFGCDYSQGLLKICRGRGFEVARTDCLSLPFRSESVDGVICIAVIHHLSTQGRRQKAIEEMARILRPKGLALIYAWAQEQERNSVPSTYLKQQKSESIDSKKSENIEEKEFENQSGENTDLKKSIEFPLVLPIHKNRTNFEHSDLLVPWKTKEANALTVENVDSKTFLRYYHVFKERELEDLIRESPNLSSILTIKESYYDQGNWCVILVKNNH